MKKKVRRKTVNAKALLVAAFMVAAVILGTLMVQKYLARQGEGTPPLPPQPAGTVSVSLFFAAQDARGLVRESREIGSCSADLSSCISATLEELANGPLGDLSPTLPTGSTFRSVIIRGDTAIVDLGKELAENLPKGSSAEMTAVYSIVNTVSYNFPAIKKVKFLLEGHEITTLGGHLELDKPLEPDFRLELRQG